ncbi:transmembrane protein 51b isoform X2 [Nematolebias whitei]|nr:transmembrane protein 51b isoform X2 [Nematolebias whitei]
MIVWTVIPEESVSVTSPTSSGNFTSTPSTPTDADKDRTKSSSVALVLVGVGIVMLLLSICLGIRSKRRAQRRSNQTATAAAPYRVAGQEESSVDPSLYNVPSYEEAVGSGNYPVRQSNLRHSTSQLPSYEDILAAVENEGRDQPNNSTEDAPLNDQGPTSVPPDAEPGAESSGLAPTPSLPTRSASRASRFLKPLRVRRIKSDKLHLKDFRLQIRSPTQNPVTIEPITPPPQYENKMPELQ